MYDTPQFIPQGWQCPVCKRVYAPGYPWCTFCGQETYVTNATKPEKKDETILKISDIHPGYMPDVHLWGDTKTGEG